LIVVRVFFSLSYFTAKKFGVKNVGWIWVLILPLGMARPFPLYLYLVEKKKELLEETHLLRT